MVSCVEGGILTGKGVQKLLQDEDSVRYYYLCADCLRKVEVVNGPPVEQSPSYFAV